MVTQKEYNLSQYFEVFIRWFLKQDDRHYIDIVSGQSNLTYAHLIGVLTKYNIPIEITKKIIESLATAFVHGVVFIFLSLKK